MKILITRKDNGIKEIECSKWRITDGVLRVMQIDKNEWTRYESDGEQLGGTRYYETEFYACTDWLDVEVVDE